MNKELFFKAVLKFTLGFLIVSLLLFVPAGTINFWNAWVFIIILFVPMFIAGIFLMFKSPSLLKKRLNAKEKDKEQKKVIAFSGLMFAAGFIIAGLNFRFKFLILPDFMVYIFVVLFLISYALYAVVLKQNVYLSRTIEVQVDQKVIDTGLYSLVRHPMYMVTLFLFLSIPFILGSLISFLLFLFYPALIVKRIKNEEKFLEQNLNGYLKYKNKVKYRLIPYVW